MKTEAPHYSYPKRDGYFDPASDCVVCQTLDTRFPDLKSQREIDAALRKASVGLRYVVVFAAGWFLSAVVSLARLKGWI